MGAKNQKEYQCSVVNETVKIHRRKKTKAGFAGGSKHFVQCDQAECQYVDENIPPCPLTLSLFEEEISELDELLRRRRGSGDYY